MSINVLLLPAF